MVKIADKDYSSMQAILLSAGIHLFKKREKSDEFLIILKDATICADFRTPSIFMFQILYKITDFAESLHSSHLPDIGFVLLVFPIREFHTQHLGAVVIIEDPS